MLFAQEKSRQLPLHLHDVNLSMGARWRYRCRQRLVLEWPAYWDAHTGACPITKMSGRKNIKDAIMRNDIWDKWKGLAILSVVTIHALATTLEFPIDSPNFQFGLFARQFVNFAVPLFLAISGYFSFSSVSASRNYWSYIQNRISRLLPPYLLWTVVYLLIRMDNPFSSLSHFAMIFFAGTGIDIGYFVIVLIQFIFLAPFIHRLTSKKAHLTLMIILSATGLALSYFLRLGFTDLPISKFPLSVLFFIVWYPFFHLGIYVRMFPLNATRWRPLILSLLGIFFLLSLIEAIALTPYSVSVATSQIKVSSFLVSSLLFLCISMTSQSSSDGAINRILVLSGRNSYLIYLCHLLFLVPISRLLGKVSILHENQFILVPVSVLIVFGSCLVLAYALSRVIPTSFRKFVGT